MSNRLPRILVLYNLPVLPPEHPDYASEVDVVETVDEIEKVLPADKYVVERFGYAREPRDLLRKLDDWKPDAVFNLFEGEADRTETEIHNAALLESFGVPFTGAGTFGLALARDKIRTKYVLAGAGVRSAPFMVVACMPVADWPHLWPAIVKPAYQDASVGIDQGSVVDSQAELHARVEYVLKTYGGPVLVEQFIHGRELHVNMFEDPVDGRLRIIPPAELQVRIPRRRRTAADLLVCGKVGRGVGGIQIDQPRQRHHARIAAQGTCGRDRHDGISPCRDCAIMHALMCGSRRLANRL